MLDAIKSNHSLCIIDSGGDVDVAVTSTKEIKVSAVRESFQEVFGKVILIN